MQRRDIVVVGASAGGLEVLGALLRNLPRDLPAAIFIVMHVSPHHKSLLPDLLARSAKMPCGHAADGERIRSSRVYVAPPDRHMLLQRGHVRLTKGPKENRSRPAVDTLFRSAAYNYGPRVIGIVLSGTLDDGTAGLWAIKDRGGVAVVQDPEEAVYPSMPLNARQNVKVDHCLPLAEIAGILPRLIGEEAGRSEDYPVSKELEIEAKIALESDPLANGVLQLGHCSIFTCPSCHGALIEMKRGGFLRFRCHTGHAFSVQNLLAELKESTEESVWSARRAVDEKIMLLRHLARHAREAGETDSAALFERELEDAERQLGLLREAALFGETPLSQSSAEGD